MDSKLAILHQSLVGRLATVKDEVIGLSRFIHENVEVSGEEFLCSARICDVLYGHGFRVRRKIAGLETSFVGEYGSPDAETSVAFLCEFDGLPPYGQSCGHNVVSASSVGAALLLLPFVEELDLRIVVIGTPAEETFGGKYALADAGVFKGLNAALLIYPGMDDIASSRALCATGLKVEVTGQAAHAAAHPELGRSALDGLILGYVAMSTLRQFLPSSVRVHAIIKNGGTHPQIVPDFAEASVVVRAPDLMTLETAKSRVVECFNGAGSQTGTTVTLTEGVRISEALLPNATLARAYETALRMIGREPQPTDPLAGAWSTDAGYLSRFVPLLQPQLKMTSRTISPHSNEFHTASSGMDANDATVAAALSLAISAVQIALDEDLRIQIMKDYEAALDLRTVEVNATTQNHQE